MYSSYKIVTRTKRIQYSYRHAFYNKIPSESLITPNKETEQVLTKACNLFTYTQCANCTGDICCDDLAKCTNFSNNVIRINVRTRE